VECRYLPAFADGDQGQDLGRRAIAAKDLLEYGAQDLDGDTIGGVAHVMADVGDSVNSEVGVAGQAELTSPPAPVLILFNPRRPCSSTRSPQLSMSVLFRALRPCLASKTSRWAPRPTLSAYSRTPRISFAVAQPHSDTSTPASVEVSCGGVSPAEVE
jgi:hypothetical protein